MLTVEAYDFASWALGAVLCSSCPSALQQLFGFCLWFLSSRPQICVHEAGLGLAPHTGPCCLPHPTLLPRTLQTAFLLPWPETPCEVSQAYQLPAHQGGPDSLGSRFGSQLGHFLLPPSFIIEKN